MRNVLLVFGGKSYEHDISVVTASQIYNKTKIQDINLILFYVSRNGEYLVYESKKFVLADFSKSKFSTENKKFKKVAFVSGEKNILFYRSAFGLKEYIRVDSAIFACHGAEGENGKLVSVFESLNIACSAGNFDALAICMNKYLFKQTMKGLKIPVVRGFKVSLFEYEKNKDVILKKIKRIGVPIILKSNNGGSSIGLFTVKEFEQLETNLELAFEFDREVIVEKLIEDAREFNVACIGTPDNFEISEIDEPIKNSDILSFTDKYLAGGSKNSSKLGGASKTSSMVNQLRKFPADIDVYLSEKIKNIAKKIFVNLGLCGVVRIDFLYCEKTEKLYVCEVNTIPGSLAYYFFCRNSVLVNELVLKLLKVADKNRENFKLLNQDFCTKILD